MGLSNSQAGGGPNSIICNPGLCLDPPVTFFLQNWFLFLAAVVSGGLLIWPMLGKGGGLGGKLSTSDAVNLLNRERAVMIDVSEPADYAAGHPAGAKSVPLGQIENSRALPTNKTLPVVVVCSNGSRAGKGVEALKKLGFENTRALAGGLAAWRAADLPVEKTA